MLGNLGGDALPSNQACIDDPCESAASLPFEESLRTGTTSAGSGVDCTISEPEAPTLGEGQGVLSHDAPPLQEFQTVTDAMGSGGRGKGTGIPVSVTIGQG